MSLNRTGCRPFRKLASLSPELSHLEINVDKLCMGLGRAVENGLKLHPASPLGACRNELQPGCCRVVYLSQGIDQLTLRCLGHTAAGMCTSRQTVKQCWTARAKQSS